MRDIFADKFDMVICLVLLALCAVTAVLHFVLGATLIAQVIFITGLVSLFTLAMTPQKFINRIFKL